MEIKFRAWDSMTKVMKQVDVLAISPCTWDCPDYNTYGMSIAYQPHIKLMQFTGLTDKNSKEIYKGDILQRKYMKNNEEVTELYEVVYGLGCFNCEKISARGISCSLGFYCTNVKMIIEVIGNIYENPSLLEVAP